MGAGSPAKQATRWMAPARPVFAGAPAPTGMVQSFSWWAPCVWACPRSRRCGGWHRLRRCSRVNPLPQVRRIPSAGGSTLWERACPRSKRRGGWHRLGRCSRARPLPQVRRTPSAGGVPVGAGLPAKQAARWMAPATPVFAGEPAPTGTAHSFSWWVHPVGAGMPAKQATRWMAPAAPVFAGEPAPTGIAWLPF